MDLMECVKRVNLEEVVHKIVGEQPIICCWCGKEHKADANTFYAVYGNICIGLMGGVVGNNLDAGGTVRRASFFCRGDVLHDSCFPTHLEY